MEDIDATKEFDLPYLTALALQIAKEAGAVLLGFYQQPHQNTVTHKADNSPVTLADIASHQFIVDKLNKTNIPVISEEDERASDFRERTRLRAVWLVDPLDGTQEFIARTGEFTVNIALVVDNIPVLGVIYAPFLQLVYFAWDKGGAYKQVQDLPIERIRSTKYVESQLVRILTSRRHDSVAHFLAEKGLGETTPKQLIQTGSALKFGLLAEGSGDIYPRLANTSEWDTAAGQSILQEAGGSVVKLTGEILNYNARPTLVNPHFLAVADKTYPWLNKLSLPS